MKNYDLVVVGGGSGGYAAARTATGLGLETALVEGAEEPGGLCILKGCMPTKALLHATGILHQSRNSSVLGLDIPRAGFDFLRVMERKDEMVRRFASWREEGLRRGGFTFIEGTARFVDPHRIRLDSGREIRAAHFVVATGSEASPPPLPDLEGIGCLTSDRALELQERPSSLIVLGGGAVALEFAQFFSRLDTRVTIVQRSERLLRDFDEDAAAELERALRSEGMDVYLGTRLLSADRKGEQRSIRFAHRGTEHEIEAEAVLLATGRRPRTGALQLEAAGVRTERGRILCNERMQTSMPHIYAAGDCTGPRAVVHMAVLQGETAAWNIARGDAPRTMDDRLALGVVFTDPQVARTGLTEMEAGRCGIPCLAATHPFDDHGKSLIMNVRFGFVKLLAHAGSGAILGGTCVGPGGGDLIHEITVAMAGNMTAAELAGVPHYHPTLAEIWTHPAEELAERIGTP